MVCRNKCRFYAYSYAVIVASVEHEVWGTDLQGKLHPWRASDRLGWREFARSGWDVNVSKTALWQMFGKTCIFPQAS